MIEQRNGPFWDSVEGRTPLPPAAATLGLELVVWLVPSLVGGGVTVAFVGFLLGPIFPIVMNHAGGVLPPELIVGAVGWMASFSSADRSNTITTGRWPILHR